MNHLKAINLNSRSSNTCFPWDQNISSLLSLLACTGISEYLDRNTCTKNLIIHKQNWSSGAFHKIKTYLPLLTSLPVQGSLNIWIGKSRKIVFFFILMKIRNCHETFKDKFIWRSTLVVILKHNTDLYCISIIWSNENFKCVEQFLRSLRPNEAIRFFTLGISRYKEVFSLPSLLPIWNDGPHEWVKGCDHLSDVHAWAGYFNVIF